ncbi:MAG: hypothetical protein FWD16_02485 [Clostridia bacterium]|nr:hypothetical protein [Clostridia bacterium]
MTANKRILTTWLVLLVLSAVLLPLGLAPQAAGTGSKADPYLVTTPQELDNIRNNLTAYYRITKPIDLSGFANWVPIGSHNDRFEGGLDGGGFAITGLKINRKEERNIGLFGACAPTVELDNINLVDVNIIGGGRTGGLCGVWGNVYMRDCCPDNDEISQVSGHRHTAYHIDKYGTEHKDGFIKGIQVSGRIEGKYFVGGILGYADGFQCDGGSISNSVNRANVYCNTPEPQFPTLDKWRNGTHVGGIIGKMRHSAPFTVTKCVNFGTVYNKYGSCSGGIVGTLTGWREGTDAYGSREICALTNCANFGKVYAGIGGLAGGISGSLAYNAEKTAILDCFNGGPVFGNKQAGGILGEGGPEIARCAFVCDRNEPEDQDAMTTGLYVHTVHAGGIVGMLTGVAAGGASITDCYAYFTANSAQQIYINMGGLVGTMSNNPFNIGQCWSSIKFIGQNRWANVFYETGARNTNFNLDRIYYDIERAGLDPDDEFAQVYPCFIDLHGGKEYTRPGDYKALMTGAMSQKDTFEWLDFEDTWDIEDGDTFPYLRGLKKLATELGLNFEDMIKRVGNFPTPMPTLEPTLSPTAEATTQPADATPTPSGSITSTETATSGIHKKGDINGDGFVNIDDILLLRDIIFGKTPTAGQLAALKPISPEGKATIDTILAVRDIIFDL